VKEFPSKSYRLQGVCGAGRGGGLQTDRSDWTVQILIPITIHGDSVTFCVNSIDRTMSTRFAIVSRTTWKKFVSSVVTSRNVGRRSYDTDACSTDVVRGRLASGRAWVCRSRDHLHQSRTLATYRQVGRLYRDRRWASSAGARR